MRVAWYSACEWVVIDDIMCISGPNEDSELGLRSKVKCSRFEKGKDLEGVKISSLRNLVLLYIFISVVLRGYKSVRSPALPLPPFLCWSVVFMQKHYKVHKYAP